MRRRWWTWKAALVAAMAAGLVIAVAGTASAQGGAGRALAEGITVGPDGNIWFTEFHTRRIGRITPRREDHPLRRARARPGRHHHRAGRRPLVHRVRRPDRPHHPDGQDLRAPRALRQLPRHRVRPGRSPVVRRQGRRQDRRHDPAGLCDRVQAGPGLDAGGDHRRPGRQHVGDALLAPRRRAHHPGGRDQRVPAPASTGNPSGIAVGGDGALWFSLAQFPGVGRVATDGAITQLPLPGAGPGGATGIAAGSDGALWLPTRRRTASAG